MGKKMESSILIIEDDRSLLDSLATLLRGEGWRVDTAMTGREALTKSKKGLYHVAIIDIRLPDVEGTDLLDKLRETVPHTRKIILTGYPDLENAVKALNRGADMYLIKPIESEKLLNIIKGQLKKRKEEVKYSQKKVGKFIKTRVAELEEREE